MAIIFIGNFCYTLKASLDVTLLNSANAEDEFEVLLAVPDNNTESNLIDKFQGDMNKLDVYDNYSLKLKERGFLLSDSSERLEVTGYRHGLKSFIEPEVIEGEHWGQEDIGSNNIWLASIIANEKKLSIGNKVTISENEIQYDEKGEKTTS